jgi:hypothetical protein
MLAAARAIFAVVGLVNLAPIAGATSARALTRLYGATLEDEHLVTTLLRHRAVLLGTVGAGLVAAALRPELAFAASAAGLVSMLSFVVIAARRREREIRRIVGIDAVASLALVAATAFGEVV